MAAAASTRLNPLSHQAITVARSVVDLRRRGSQGERVRGIGAGLAEGFLRVRDAVVEGVVAATNGRWTVVTPDERLVADRVVIAAGYWSRHIAASLGVTLPIQSGAGFSVRRPDLGRQLCR